MDDESLLQLQRRLRRRLFEGSGAIRWRPARELAAQLLLYLDEPQRCWQLTSDWLRETLDADRVDGGFGGWVGADGRARSYVVLAEARRDSLALPSVLGLHFNAADPSIRAVWSGVGVAAITEVAQERRFSAGMRGTLQALGTSAKLALPLRDAARPVGLICADWHRRAPRWDEHACNQLPELAAQLLGPVFAACEWLASARTASGTGPGIPPGSVPSLGTGIDDAAMPRLPAPPPRPLSLLTPAELKVAHMVATGLSYKEVALRLDRSLSTVDHQLRSIRAKLGVRSTARLVHLLSEPAGTAGA